MTTEAVASAKLSERLFNELHFSHIPTLFDAKYLAVPEFPRRCSGGLNEASGE